MFYVYVLLSEDEDQKTYIGYSSDLKKRLASHNSVENTGWTANRKWKLVYYEAYASEKDARVRESKLKQDGRSRYQLMNRIKKSLACE